MNSPASGSRTPWATNVGTPVAGGFGLCLVDDNGVVPLATYVAALGVGAPGVIDNVGTSFVLSRTTAPGEPLLIRVEEPAEVQSVAC